MARSASRTHQQARGWGTLRTTSTTGAKPGCLEPALSTVATADGFHGWGKLLAPLIPLHVGVPLVGPRLRVMDSRKPIWIKHQQYGMMNIR